MMQSGEKRTLYHYNTQEIADLSEAVLKMSQEAKEVGVILIIILAAMPQKTLYRCKSLEFELR